ncbi:SUMF1/EgtB/PvdO family nonheme iron enzyme [Nannocystis sp. SCPEA4]|uniref:formylglycine-generating enzyme family protein n=1 Tax=Nannocystis sp. SCPEA4 TaxID=2996787 RepID=UPI00226D9F20|nr:SUMF1/EgtB/PvdO family nonheme iron enzyme [Nannocystis sp. SCPEA4]MCY1056455.1 SUMF1/EgtB/PvdO family nonheme iron enzyme [Nannocystis sp. SCPEA4]
MQLTLPLVLGVTLSLGPVCGCNPPDADGTTGGTTGPGPFEELAGMMRVPAGKFWRGCNEVSGPCEDDPVAFLALNVPYRELELSEFWIDKYEVTVEEYEACGTAGACTAPNGVAWSDVSPPDVANLPVTGVSWEQAVMYCAWRGKRLPTEAEWEKAARGTDGRRYPWGNEHPLCGQVHLLLGEPCERIRHVLPVDAHPRDISPYGVIGMAGNVQEWVQDWRGKTYYAECPAVDPPGPKSADADSDYKIVRGGYWDSSTKEGNTRTSVALRRWDTVDGGTKGRIGFRCARSEPPA